LTQASCEVDAKKICERAKDMPIREGQYATDNAMLENDSVPAEQVSMPYYSADGKQVAQLSCWIDFQNGQHRVRWAMVTEEPDAAGAAFLKQAGLCKK
jgi:hypothetical protein